MTAHDLFKIANMVALVGWIALLASPWAPRVADRVAGTAIPLLLSVLYTGLILAFWSRAEGGFGTLADVMKLFTTAEVALAGWVHYLAFDLLIGAWIVRTGREAHIAFPLLVPCLMATFLVGPAGYLAFTALRWTTARASGPSTA